MKTGLLPANTTASAVATNVKLGKMTSSLALTPAAMIAACKAAVPVLTAIACFTPAKIAYFFQIL